MGSFFSCPFSESNDLESGFESIIVRSISFGNDESKTTTRSISFNSRDLEPTIMKSLGCGKMMVEGSISFQRRENETKVSILAPTLLDDKENKSFIRSISSTSEEMVMDPPDNLKHEAAVTLQKVYKSFRVRRKIADCAVQLVEQRWWQLLDYAELKRSTESFVEFEKQETALSRWSRAKIRAAKVGKGLSKNGKAQKLALQHWLEAIDPRHRYGHNLQFYYAKWLNCQSTEHFFHWLDIGEGKEVNLVEKCPRWKLQQQCIRYLGPLERKTHEVVVEDGKLLFLQTGQLVDTTGGSKDDKWIFVLSTSKALYIGKKNKGTFQHSSFLAGGATISAGRLVAENGVLKAIWRHSGHYQPTEENFNDFISYLTENHVDLSEVKMSPCEGEEERILNIQRSNLYRETMNQTTSVLQPEESNVEETKNVMVQDDNEEDPWVDENGYESADEEGYVSDQEVLLTPKQNLFDEEKNTTKESMLQRIDSCKGLNSYRLGKQLSGSWTNGTGPRIGCVGEYPSELRIRALEHANLSPRCTQNS